MTSAERQAQLRERRKSLGKDIRVFLEGKVYRRLKRLARSESKTLTQTVSEIIMERKL